MFLCFFSLSSSMTGNLNEQSKEIAVLRAIGFKSHLVVRLYVYEAFILIISASVQGICIGTLVGWSMAIEQSLFVHVPVSYVFPYLEFFAILIISMICAFWSTYGPCHALLSNSIPNIMRIQ
mmetsp:Transcript_5556/g.3923  ORF Transcript_5556/g.3923 Transcript_5556/m.3923 type:complete len:122 (+) Transcript_5556:2968-3333(+)